MISVLKTARRSNAVAAALGVATLVANAALHAGDLPPLIPRAVLFGNPDRTSPRISPDGSMLAFLAPHDGVMNVWVRGLKACEERVITHDRGRGIRAYMWAHNGRQILYIQDRDGDENWHLFAVDLADGVERDLTPFEGVQTRLVADAAGVPNEFLVGINQRNPQWHDVYRVNLANAQIELDTENNEGFIGFVADHNLRVRAAARATADGGIELFHRESTANPWRNVLRWAPDDAFNSGVVGFTPKNDGLYVISSAGANASELQRFDPQNGKIESVASDHFADVADVLQHPVNHEVQAVGFNKERMHWQVVDPKIKRDFALIARNRPGNDFKIIDRDHADLRWLVAFITDDGPRTFYIYDREERAATRLFSDRKELEDVALARMVPVGFRARDGLLVPAYLTVPPGLAPRKLPMVLLVNNGPWSRVSWGYDATAQWLANRGYAVLQINFRGSSGYGKQFLNAGNREWGGKIQADLVDGVRWAVERGIADPERIGIFGTSFGGYAALMALSETPDVFRCAVDICGPSSLVTFITSLPPYLKSIEPLIFDRIGHPERDAEFLESRSPMHRVHRINKPLLIAQGANDPRVKKSEARQMVKALEDAGKEVVYREYEDEGHGFARPENRLDFYAVAEKFLAKHLGGRYEE
jgi:dipeptidyl aminopeptidase/acylaminoacyl peptidase